MSWRLIKIIENDAILENQENEKIQMPWKFLPEDINIGENINISFTAINQINDNNKDKQKKLLNTLLNS